MTDVKLEEPEFVDADAVDLPEGRRLGGRGTIVTLTTVIALLVAIALTVLGLGAADTAVSNVDSNSWLWSSTRGEVDRVNGVTARVDTRAKITDAQNHEIQITQNDKYLILRDLETGQVTALDLTTLQVSAVMPTTPGLGINVELYGDVAFVVDGVQGVVRQLDPRTLTPVGDPVTLRRGIISGGFDGHGLLWVGLPSEGTVVAIQPGANGGSPTVTHTFTATDPGHDLVLSSLDTGVAVLDNTAPLLAVVTDKVTQVALPIDRPGTLPRHTAGSPIAVTVPDDRLVVLVDGQSVTKMSVAGNGPIGAAVAYAGRVYVPDPQTGVVHETTPSGQVTSDIKIPSPTGKVELEVHENYLFINSPDGPDARVVDSDHVVHDVNKYAEGVLGGDPPPPPPSPPVPPPPPVSVPSAPQVVTATAGDGTATITWKKAADNGAPVTKYVVEGDNGVAKVVVSGDAREAVIPGLTNGKTYKFSVYAVNAQGAGPRAYTNPVTPTRDVPDPPASVTATANPDGTVDITWPAANGQGHQVTQYRVSALNGAKGTEASVGAVNGTSMKVADGALSYGTQYTFTVVSVNDANAASVASGPSNTVIPFNKPAAPISLAAATDGAQRGAVQVSWQAPTSNGRPITGYEVVLPGGTVSKVTGTSTTVTGLPDDTAVTVKVHAVNAAGAGPDATASARTMGTPSLTVTGTSSGYNQIQVTITPNNKGGNATCTISSNGATQSAACGTAAVTFTVGGLWPNGTYNFAVTISNPVGSANASGSVSTNQLHGTSICGTPSYCSQGAWAYSQPLQNSSYGLFQIPVGATFTPACHTANGPNIRNVWGGKSGNPNAAGSPVNNNIWLKTTYNGKTAYFPWVWTNLDGGDNINLLPGC